MNRYFPKEYIKMAVSTSVLTDVSNIYQYH